MTSGRPALVWFRRDLRLDDNPAWNDATASADTVVPVFVVDARLLDRSGPFRRRRLLRELRALDADIATRHGGRLHVRVGDPGSVVPALADAHRVGSVHWNADVSPYATRRDATVQDALEVPVHRWWGTLVHEPGRVRTASGTTSKVFTPFFRRWTTTERADWPEPHDCECTVDAGDGIPELDDPPSGDGDEATAFDRLEAFLDRIDDVDRERIDRRGTSHLSIDLKFGTISPRTVVDLVGDATPARAALIRQLAWRDWFAHLLVEHRMLATSAMRPALDQIEWRNDPDEIAAWAQGRTGIPIVDAGMRELHRTGWLHNRVRMVCASFLVKNLLVDWRIGERHFRHWLSDGDVAQNVGNWQWVAGTGPDAAPYHRIFNPVVQARRFDPTGDYVRRWVPELAHLQGDAIHAPWELGDGDLFDRPPDDYPSPLVDLAESRVRALAAYAAVRAGATRRA